MTYWVNGLRTAMKGIEVTLTTPRQSHNSEEDKTAEKRESNEEENLYNLSTEELVSKIRTLESELKKAREALLEKDQELQQLRSATSTK